MRDKRSNVYGEGVGVWEEEVGVVKKIKEGTGRGGIWVRFQGVG